MRHEVAALLGRRRDAGTTYFGGGTLAAALAGKQWQVFRPSPAQRLTDGTSHFHGIVALAAGMRQCERLAGASARHRPMAAVHSHAVSCARRAAAAIARLRHPNGRPVAVVFGCWGDDDGSDGGGGIADRQGPVVTFNVLRPNGTLVGYAEVIACAGALWPTAPD